MKKKQKPNPDAEKIDLGVELFAALAHRARLRVLLEINESGALTVGQLVDRIGVEQSSLSHQLAILRRIHLLRSEIDGKSRIYKLVDKHVAHIIEDAIIHAQEKPPKE